MACICSQTFLSSKAHNLQDFISMHHYAPEVSYMYLYLVHACIMFTHCLAQLQDESAVHVHHLNTPNRALPISLQAMLKDAFSSANIFNDTSLGPLLPALQAEVLTFMSQHKAMSDISAPEGPATAVAGRLGLHATYGHAQVLAVPVFAWLGCLAWLITS